MTETAEKPAFDSDSFLAKILADLPPELAAANVPTGLHREGIKFQVHGPAKAGKSFLLASQPSPNLALACGENGIGMYLDKKRGDFVLQVYDAETLDRAVKFAVKHEGDFASFSWDNANLAWGSWMEYWKAKLNKDDIQGKSWNPVKHSWKILAYLIMQTRMNCGLGFWPKGARYVTEEEVPGVEKLKIYEQDVAHAERTLPFTIDHLLKVDAVLDKLMRPTGVHTVTLFGGRVPKGTPPDLFHSGKVWKFNSRKPSAEGPWQEIFGPLLPLWREHERSHLDLETRDPFEMEEVRADITETATDVVTIRLIKDIEACPDAATARDKWGKEWSMIYEHLEIANKALVDTARQRAKTRWGKA